MISPTAQAILLLTTHLTSNGNGSVRPLTPAEWGRFAEWLQKQSLTPEMLLQGSPRTILKDWRDTRITVERIEALLDRGSTLAFALEKWFRSGLWVITRADPDYPPRLKQRLGKQAPAVLFGSGNRHLLQQGGVAVVGSRNVKEADLQYSRELGARVARCGYSVISGGARGVDEAAMLGALEVEGTAVGVLSNSLLRACSSQKYRDFLRQKSLV
ncbi:MAG: DNA-processing protein DprA, partial [Calditrichaeota bacterium]